MSENILLEARLAKLDYVKGITNPYPERFERTHELYEAGKLEDGIGGFLNKSWCSILKRQPTHKMNRLSFSVVVHFKYIQQQAGEKPFPCASP